MINGIKNLFKYFKVIWNDRWYDSHFIFKLLKFKLELMEKNFRKNGIHLYAEKDADKMKLCILLLDRLIKDEYTENAFRYHNEKWGEPEFSTDDSSKFIITHKNVITEKDREQERKEFCIINDKTYGMEKQDVNYLFSFLSKNILTWWD